MNTIKSLILSVLVLFSAFAGSANAVTVSVVPGKSVVLCDEITYGGYCAGLVTLNIDGKEYPAMTTDFLSTLAQDPSTISGSWDTTLYTRAEIIAGGIIVYYSPEDYNTVAQVFAYALLGYNPPDPLWAAGHNEMVWDIMISTNTWQYGDRVYDTDTGITVHDMYTYDYLAPGLDPKFDYSGFMEVLTSGGGQRHEFLVYTSSVPVPPAVWLFGSGFIGLVGVARRRK